MIRPPFTVDLRSDTVTRPTSAMRRAMAEALVGDDVFGDDPTVLELEEMTAELLGQEAALFVPSGTMANEIAIAAHTERGDEVICEASSHVYLYEGGGAAWLSGSQIQALVGERGLLSAEQVQQAVRPDDPHHPRSRLLCLENTHNRAGGHVLPAEGVTATLQAARSLGLRTHLDGARLWNAAVAMGRSERALTSGFDSISVCFSKGLGAPIGSAVAGPAPWIARARRIRKVLGGGMRQAGIIAAGALHALRHHRVRLEEDHRRARDLAVGLMSIPGIGVALESVETNIVVVPLSPSAAEPERWVAQLADRGIGLMSLEPRTLRFVTHLDVDDAGIARALEAVRSVSGELAGARALRGERSR